MPICTKANHFLIGSKRDFAIDGVTIKQNYGSGVPLFRCFLLAVRHHRQQANQGCHELFYKDCLMHDYR
jgi:hypothetical protein